MPAPTPSRSAGHMGLLAETGIINQLKKAQGETNRRLDALHAEQQHTNLLLEQILAVVAKATTGKPAEG